MNMKKFLLSLVALMAFGTSAWADGITIPDARIAASRFSKLKVTVESTTPYRDLQFDLTLPEGITLKDATNGGTVVDEASNHVLKFEADADNASLIHFVVVDAIIDIDQNIDETTITAEQKANYGKTFTNGIVVEIPINAAADFQGTKTANLSNINASFDNGASAFTTAGTGTFDIKAVLLGDVDDSGVVNVNDALWIAEFSLGQVETGFVEEAAYVDTDEAINVNDALRAAEIALGSSASVKKMFKDVDVDEEESNELDPE